MANKRRAEPPILQWLEEEFARTRKKIVPPFPYDQATDTIKLPREIKAELYALIQKGEKVQAVKRVTELTGAGLRVSKDYVDALAITMGKTE